MLTTQKSPKKTHIIEATLPELDWYVSKFTMPHWTAQERWLRTLGYEAEGTTVCERYSPTTNPNHGALILAQEIDQLIRCGGIGQSWEAVARGNDQLVAEGPTEWIAMARCFALSKGREVFEIPVDPSRNTPTSELKRLALNWAVAKSLGYEVTIANKDESRHKVILVDSGDTVDWVFEPSTNPAQCEPLIKELGLTLEPFKGDENDWVCFHLKSGHVGRGDTKCIAASRCIVDLKIGYEIQLPDELLIQMLKG